MTHQKSQFLLLCFFSVLAANAQIPMSEQQQDTYDDSPEKEKNIHTLIANYTTEWITTEITTPVGTKTGLHGSGYEIGYRALFANNLGLGIYYEHNETDYPSSYSKTDKFKYNYIGFSFVYGGYVDESLIASVESGLGYSYFNDGYQSDGGACLKMGLGIEYRLSTLIGIGAGLHYNFIIASRQQETGYTRNKNEIAGFKQLSLHAGLRIYLGK